MSPAVSVSFMVTNTRDHGEVELVSNRIHAARTEERDEMRVEYTGQQSCGDDTTDGRIA